MFRQEQVEEIEVTTSNWLDVYKEYLSVGYHVRLKSTTVDGHQKLSIVYWSGDGQK